jgi:hypothetical protein
LTLAAKLAAAIVVQQAEVDRLTTATTVDLAAARQKLQTLQQMAGRITPQLEQVITVAKAAGIRLDD